MTIEQDLSYRPRVPRETRRLLVAALLALLSIWALARLRFPDRPAAPNPVAPLLDQLNSPTRFSDLASQIAATRSGIESVVLPIGATDLTALRIRDDVLVAWSRADAADPPGVVTALDRASGLVLIKTTPVTSAPAPRVWPPERLDQPRYMIAARARQSGLLLEPFFAPTLEPFSNPIWPGTVWEVPGDIDVRPGSFVFTEDGQLVGLSWRSDGAVAIVPAATLLAEAERLLAEAHRAPGWLGVEVVPLTPSLTRATGASTGVVVTWRDARSPSLGILNVGDVIEAVDDRPVVSMQDWRAQTLRLSAQQALRLQVRRRGVVHQLSVTTVTRAPVLRSARLGLELRRVTGGSEVVRVEAGSIAHDAGLRPGDLVVQADDAMAPTPAAVRQLFAASHAKRPLLLAVSRDGAHLLLTLEKDAAARP